jgi:hypothetical protein
LIGDEFHWGFYDLFCERCGQRFLPKEAVCGRCRVAPTRHWLQLTGLATLAIAIGCNSFSALFLLPRLAAGRSVWPLRYWMQVNDAVSFYGWVVAAVTLLLWSFWARRGYSLQKGEWPARILLLLLLLAGVATMPLPWRPAGPTPHIHAVLHNHPGLGPGLAWGLIALALSAMCADSEVRDSLLGHGRALSVVSLAMLLSVVAIALAGWSITN